MSDPRTPGTSFSVARLLADLPSERLSALETAWGLDRSSAIGRIAALYRRMTDPGGRADVVSRFPDATRLVFVTLAKARKPLTPNEIGRVLPFSDEDIDRSLAALEATGLSWRAAAIGRDRSSGEGRWFVPLEMCDRPTKTRPRFVGNGTSGESEAALQPPGLRVLAVSPRVVRASGIVALAISALLDSIVDRATPGAVAPAAALSYAEHCGITLGVLTRHRAGFVEGSRADAWRQARPAEQIRALARLWLVDGRSGHDVPEWVRRRIWDVLKGVDRSAWYDLSSVAGRMAWRLAAIGTNAGEATADRIGPDPRRLMTRRQVDGAIEALGWIGVIAIGDDERGRPIAIRLGEHGEFALA